MNPISPHLQPETPTSQPPNPTSMPPHLPGSGSAPVSRLASALARRQHRPQHITHVVQQLTIQPLAVAAATAVLAAAHATAADGASASAGPPLTSNLRATAPPATTASVCAPLPLLAVAGPVRGKALICYPYTSDLYIRFLEALLKGMQGDGAAGKA